jgi:SAM-dependent methyltransferase
MDLNPVPEYCRYLLEPMVGDSMLELGNKKSGDLTYKSWFTAQGIRHVSVDINGLDGALKLDLREPLNLGQFDMVTNFGTTEHVVDNQYQAWKNIHEAVKLGGVYIGMCPSPGDWWWHGEHYPSMDFYRQFADLNGYEIEHMAIGREHPNRNIDVRLRKFIDTAFTMPDAGTLFYNQMRPR